MYSAFSVVMILISLFLVSYPFWLAHRGKWPDEIRTTPEEGAKRSLSASGEKDVLMTTLAEIEFDYHMKKMSEKDYINLKHEYARAAIAALETERSGGGGAKTLNPIEGTCANDKPNGKVLHERARAGLVKPGGELSAHDFTKDIETEIENEIERELAALKARRGG